MVVTDVILTEITHIKDSIQEIKKSIKNIERPLQQNTAHRNRQQVVNKVIFAFGGALLGAVSTISVILITRII